VVIGARLAYDVTLVEGQVVIFEDLDQVPMPEAVSAASTNARLGSDDGRSQDVIAGVPELPISAAADLMTGGIGDGVAVLTVQTRNGVATATVGEGNRLEALLGKCEGA
jgi:hypothetical protein